MNRLRQQMVTITALVGAFLHGTNVTSAQEHLGTLETVFVGDYRALQGISFSDTYYNDGDPGWFHTSRGACVLGDIKVEESIFYWHANDWVLFDSLNLLRSLPCHVGDVSVDQDYLYVPMSNDHASPYLLLRLDKDTLENPFSWDLTPFAEEFVDIFPPTLRVP